MTDQNKENEIGLSPVVLGGIVGTGIGLIADVKTGRRFIKKIGQSAVVQRAGKELCNTAQDVMYEQVRVILKQRLARSMKQYQDKLFQPLQEPKKEVIEQTDEDADKYQELKDENKKLNENMSRIEEKLNKLIEAAEK